MQKPFFILEDLTKFRISEVISINSVLDPVLTLSIILSPEKKGPALKSRAFFEESDFQFSD
jgi:hypothetical protein